MMRKCFIFGLVLIIWFLISSPALAVVCRHYEGQEICILSIKRSVKKYWEYRAAVSLDGVEQPVEVYNCRGKFTIQKDGQVVQFTKNSPGTMICSFFKDRRVVPPNL
ncbi:MAG TPA: hypothetical protein VK184_05465 [Nostocaceae cyanobacterium]|nr:hypothetical protein [Nostocaceae cyanobacterium]